MRWSFFLIAFIGSMTCHRSHVEIASKPQQPAHEVAAPKVDFSKDVLPIVQRCEPCHFPGGSMHARLPFDRAETIETLGTKLFTRIRDERDQAVIRAFLDERSR